MHLKSTLSKTYHSVQTHFLFFFKTKFAVSRVPSCLTHPGAAQIILHIWVCPMVQILPSSLSLTPNVSAPECLPKGPSPLGPSCLWFPQRPPKGSCRRLRPPRHPLEMLDPPFWQSRQAGGVLFTSLSLPNLKKEKERKLKWDRFKIS